MEERLNEVADQLTEEEEKVKSLNKLKNKQEAVIADLEGNSNFSFSIHHECSILISDFIFDFAYSHGFFIRAPEAGRAEPS